MPEPPKLIVLSEQLRGMSHQLTKDLHTCGRVDDRDVTVKDPTISSHHCDFIRSGETYILRDQGSTNGTRVNNVPITEQELHNKDILQIGSVEILYDCDGQSQVTEMRTKTNIDIEIADMGKSTVKNINIENLSPYNSGAKGGGGGSTKIIIAVVVLLVLIVLALIGYLVWMQMNQEAKIPAGIVLLSTESLEGL